jgi:hypothetical protein
MVSIATHMTPPLLPEDAIIGADLLEILSTLAVK